MRVATAVRMGLRYVRGLGEAEISRIEAARLGGKFASVVDLAQRTGLPVDTLEGLAASGALESLGVSRREGLWAAGALSGMGPGRLPLAVGAEAPSLPGMPETEAARADLWATGVSVRHPVEFVRERLTARGCIAIAEALEGGGAGRRVLVGGVVTHRQRPMTAKGVIFINLEDETGLLNVIVLPEVWAAQRDVARRNPGLMIGGTLEHRDGVTNLIARTFEGWPVEGVESRDWARGRG
jgi:error-prone DNA polymerase